MNQQLKSIFFNTNLYIYFSLFSFLWFSIRRIDLYLFLSYLVASMNSFEKISTHQLNLESSGACKYEYGYFLLTPRSLTAKLSMRLTLIFVSGKSRIYQTL